MLRQRLLRIATLVVISGAILAYGGPRIGIGDPATGTPVGLIFDFSANSHGGGEFTFTNASGTDFKTIDFYVLEPFSSGVTCDVGSFFDTCDVAVSAATSGNALFDVGFEVTSNAPGIVAGSTFTVNLNSWVGGVPNTDPNGVGDWGPDRGFEVFANQAPAPEISAFPMILVGVFVLAAVALNRKIRGRRHFAALAKAAPNSGF